MRFPHVSSSFVNELNRIFRNEAQSPNQNTDRQRELGEYSNFFCNQTTGLFSVWKQEETDASLTYNLFFLPMKSRLNWILIIKWNENYLQGIIIKTLKIVICNWACFPLINMSREKKKISYMQTRIQQKATIGMQHF